MSDNRELRDAIARELGWHLVPSSVTITYPHWINNETCDVSCCATDGEPDHPVPNDISTAARVLPNTAVDIEIHTCDMGWACRAWFKDHTYVEAVGDTELEARLALALKYLEADRADRARREKA